MKNRSLLILFLSVSSFSLNSCSSDNDSVVTDPCADIVCQNGGYCVNGECVCPEGYEGADCSKQTTPLKINVTKIEVLNFPSTDKNGGGWDFTSGADIYPVFLNGSNELYKADTYYEDATSGTVYSWDLSNVSIANPLDRHIIRLYDSDGFDADDYMGGVEFSPYYKTNGFPHTQIAKFGEVEFRFTYMYVWP